MIEVATSSEQIYMIIRIKKYNRLLPARRHAVCPAFPAVLTSAVSSPDFLDFDAVNSLHRVLYLGLIGPLIHLEGVRTLDICEMHTLLGDQRSNYDIVVIHINTR